MFDNIAHKIKSVAVIFAWIGIILSVIIGLIVMCNDEDTLLQGLLIIINGSLISWLSSLTLYGFGQLIENTDILVEQGKRNPMTRTNEYEVEYMSKHQWRCKHCGQMISEDICPFCDEKQD